MLSGTSNIEQVEDNLSYMEHFEPLTEKEQEILTVAKAEYMKKWK